MPRVHLARHILQLGRHAVGHDQVRGRHAEARFESNSLMWLLHFGFATTIKNEFVNSLATQIQMDS